MPVEDEDEPPVRKGDRLVAVVHLQAVGIAVAQYAVAFDQREHCPVECPQPRVTQQTVLGERPLPAGVGVAPAVAFAREVDPFGVSEFVAHEVEIGVAAGRDGH